MTESGHGRGCACGRFTLGNAALGSSSILPVLCSHPKNDTHALRAPLRVSGLHSREANQSTRSSPSTSNGDPIRDRLNAVNWHRLVDNVLSA